MGSPLPESRLVDPALGDHGEPQPVDLEAQLVRAVASDEAARRELAGAQAAIQARSAEFARREAEALDALADQRRANTNLQARLEEAQRRLDEAAILAEAQADTIRLRNAELADKEALLRRRAAGGHAPCDVAPCAPCAALEQALADCRNANAALQEASAQKDRLLEQARAELAARRRESHAGETAALREARAFWFEKARGAESALLGLAYRLGALEHQRRARGMTDAARAARGDEA